MPEENKNKWPGESAGSQMTAEVPVVREELTLSEVKDYLTRNIYEFKTINYIYVLDGQDKLKSVFSIKELFRMPRDGTVGDVYKRDEMFAVRPDDDREKAVYLALEKNIKAVPIVDEDGIFLGAIQSDIIIDNMYNELREDILYSSGLSPRTDLDNVMEISFWQAIKHRLPWLVLGLIGGVAVARIIGFFQGVLAQNLVLAAFIPLVVYIADAARTQLEAFAVRDLALFQRINMFKYFLRQTSVVFVLAVVIGWLASFFCILLGYNLIIALVLGMAIVAASLTSVITGIIVPFLFRKLKVDPANASGPIGTIIQDIMSVSVYFLIATWLL